MDPEIIKAIIMGIVQGITEFLPVSSTAHLILFPWFFGWGGELDTLTFDVALHGGTLLALVACFYNDWIDLVARDRRKLFFIAVATVPAGVAGVLFNDIIEHTLRSPVVIIFSLTGFGLLMLAAEKYSGRSKENVDLKDSVVIGLAQAVALIPGVSRSGVTITAGLFRNLSRESAARFSFLLSMPVIAGATLLEGRKLFHDLGSYHLDVFAAGFIAAFISGFFAIKFLLYFLKRYPLNSFVYYRFLLAGVILLAHFR